VLGQDLGRNAAVAIPGHAQLNRTKVARHRFPALAVAAVTAAASFRLVLALTEMMRQFGIHRSFSQRLRQLLQ
jgi:hypothetical protein